jgi:hypothetical protein
MLDFGSSLVDLAIHRETAAGRRVFMDFNRNPLPVEGDQPFSLERLDDDVRHYLGNAGATQDLPIQRLAHMNPLAIELYRRYKVDIAAEPLEFAVNNQHMNGGILVDIWGRSSLAGCYAVGEAAGTHGVTRPGGAALNAGQVFGTRAAEDIAAGGRAKIAPGAVTAGLAERELAALHDIVRPGSSLTIKSVRASVQARMSDHGGIICEAAGVASAFAEARQLNAEIAGHGIGYAHAGEAIRAVQWHQMALASEAVLAALDHYIRNGGGSRGARTICDPLGDAEPSTRHGSLGQYRFRNERPEHREEQIVVRFDGTAMVISTRPNRSLDETEKPFFERDWPDWLTGLIHAQ